MIGTTVAHYEIVAKLGGGGMGVVYQARDTRLGRLVALKFLPQQWSHDENAKQRFVREAQAASATDHAHICTVHDIGSTDDGQLFIVMAYYDGQTLKQKLEAGGSRPETAGAGLEVDEALRIAGQIAEGLAKAHAQAVVHRDIKPGNLMLTEDGVKILDFGLAKFADSLQLTIAGSTLGTVAYMSPEQSRGEEADARSDIWAVGVVLYEMLTGELPFKGAYPEAVSYAIRNDQPAPLVGRKPEITPEIERLVFRLLEKDPAARYQNAREVARDVRLLQGFSVPLDLRTEQLPALGTIAAAPSRRSRVRKVFWSAAALVAAIVAAAAWLMRPIPRTGVVVSAVVNQTGYAELDALRSALTQTLVSDLSASSLVRVVAYERWLEMMRRFVGGEGDPSSRDALQLLTAHAGVPFVIVPTLVYENNAWHGRAEIRNAETATNVAAFETEPTASTLRKDTALALMGSLAADVERYFASAAPVRWRVRAVLGSIGGERAGAPAPPFRSLDAAAAFERGTNAYESFEYSAARAAFSEAVQADPNNPFPLAWLSRVDLLLRQDAEAVSAAGRALNLLTPAATSRDRLFVEAVAAEARGDRAGAVARYRALVSAHPDEPRWTGELAAFEDRSQETVQAISDYLRMLRLDPQLVRPHLELCRLYNRVNEASNASAHADAALAAYRRLGNRSGEAQALLCLADRLRVGRAEERTKAKTHAQDALQILQDAGDRFNVARGQQYLALTEAATGDMPAAANLWEQSLAGARETGNRALESLDLLNLGASHTLLGRHAAAFQYYRQGQVLSDALGDERRAAEQRANAAAILVDYSDTPADGFRDIQNAVGVFRTLGDHTFEVFAARVTARYYWYAGQHVESDRELNRGIAIAKQWSLDDRVAPLILDRSRVKLDVSDYSAAMELAAAAQSAAPRDSLEARVQLGRTYVKLGDRERARSELAGAFDEITKVSDISVATMHLAMGELFDESGDRANARRHFQEAAAKWTDAFPDAASVEARSLVAMLDALEGRDAGAIAAIQSSLIQAGKMGRYSLAARCRVRLARVYVHERAFDRAIEALKGIVPDGPLTLGGETQAVVHYWRGRAFAGVGQVSAAAAEAETARALATQVRESLPARFRESFASRADLRVLFQ
jgi:Tfp pilus assembly protein PilF